MLWRLPLLLLLGVHLSTQDMVTMAPSESPADSAPTQGAKVKPEIRALHIVSDIKYRYATTLVSSRVINPSNQAGKAAFTVTLPESAFISEFLMEVKGKVYKAYVKDKEQAKSLYDRAAQAGQFAGHVALDARDSNQFTVSVSIEAQGKVTFNLTYEQLLSRNLGVYSNVISINPQQIVDNMSITVNIEEPTAITKLDVPEIQVSNEVLPDKEKKNTIATVEDKSPTHKQVIWAPTPEQQKRHGNTTGVHGQFVVKYDVDREETPQNILVDEGYFVHFFAPDDLPRLKKHVVFVLDYSSSMKGRKLEQLKDAMKTILSDLDPTDYFSIVVFQTYVEVWSLNKTNIYRESVPTWRRSSIPNTNTVLDHHSIIAASPENIDLAGYYLGNFSDLEFTNIMGGLRTGLKLVEIGSEQWINDSDAPHPIMIFLTDGQPNWDETNTDAIIKKTKDLNTKKCSIYSLAFGSGADFNFLRKLSLSNYGFARTIYVAADASDQLKNFYKTVASPLLANVTFNYLPGQVDNSSNTRKNFPTFLRGSELVVAGNINKDAVKDNNMIGELRGVAASGLRTYPIIINMSRSGSPGHLEKTWAYLMIKQLLDKADTLDNGDEKNKTTAKAKELALQYSFVTPLTSLVVVKPNQTDSAVEATKVKPAATGTVRKDYTQSAGHSGIASNDYARSLLSTPLRRNDHYYYRSTPLMDPNRAFLRPPHGHLASWRSSYGHHGVVLRGLPHHNYRHQMFESPLNLDEVNSVASSPAPAVTTEVNSVASSPAPAVTTEVNSVASSPAPAVTTEVNSVASSPAPAVTTEVNSVASSPAPAVTTEVNSVASSPAPAVTTEVNGVASSLALAVTTEVNSVASSPAPAVTTESPLRKISLRDVKWLQGQLNNSITGNLTVSVQGQQYKLGMNKTDQSFGNCQVKNKSGECRHFQHCALNIFSDDVSVFIPYRCPIAGDFLGVCCPGGVQ